MSSKVYLGDAVYADVDDYGRVILTTEDGYHATNTIIFEPFVLAALEQYLSFLFVNSNNLQDDEEEETA